MKKYINSILFQTDRARTCKMSFLIVFVCFSSSLYSYQVPLSFDVLFPMVWYQKALDSSLSVWQSLINVYEKSGDGVALSFDFVLARLAFAQFCINRMYKEGKFVLPEDKNYFTMILDKVRDLLGTIVVTPKTDDFVLCADDMIESMQKSLNDKQQ